MPTSACKHVELQLAIDPPLVNTQIVDRVQELDPNFGHFEKVVKLTPTSRLYYTGEEPSPTLVDAYETNVKHGMAKVTDDF